MAHRITARWLALGLLLSLSFSTANAGENDHERSDLSGMETSVRQTPWVSSKISTPVKTRIETSFAIARQRLSEVSECRALFADRGADGLELLGSTLYYPADQAHEKQRCRGAWAFTTVGSAPTFLCRKFSKISDRGGALILIHEALHHAGMGEFPVDPNGLTSGAINNLVADACDL